MTKVALVGAGGKMGLRLTDNLKKSAYEMTYLEVSKEGIEKVESRGVKVCTDPDKAISEADIVIFAVPDVLIKKVSHLYVPKMRSGATAIFLDPAAPLSGALPKREDIAYFASHPTHPSVFNWESDKEKHFDYFGGIAAKQAIVCALIQGDDKYYAVAEELAKTMYAPVFVSHRITLKDMGILEPALSETFSGAMISKMKEALDIVVSKGVPKEAAYDFFLGHINIELALIFGQLPGGEFSDAAKKAIKIGDKLLFKDTWKDIFDEESVKEQIRQIT